MDVLRTLLQVRGLHGQHLVLPLDEVQLLPEFLRGLEDAHLLLAQLLDAPVPRLHHLLVDDDGVRVVGDHGRLRHLHLALLELEQHLDVVELLVHQLQLLVQLFLQHVVGDLGVAALLLEVRQQALHVLQHQAVFRHLALQGLPPLPHLEHPLVVGLVDALRAGVDGLVVLGHCPLERRLGGNGAEVIVRVHDDLRVERLRRQRPGLRGGRV
mmetsp:Transcript_70766/g.184519  ORF Transcript_70766/g.184519 Transcript_70766/m.184519 type:complete len:212 (-) Transcript_70766:2124-2759(-)